VEHCRLGDNLVAVLDTFFKAKFQPAILDGEIIAGAVGKFLPDNTIKRFFAKVVVLENFFCCTCIGDIGSNLWQKIRTGCCKTGDSDNQGKDKHRENITSSGQDSPRQ